MVEIKMRRAQHFLYMILVWSRKRHGWYSFFHAAEYAFAETILFRPHLIPTDINFYDVSRPRKRSLFSNRRVAAVHTMISAVGGPYLTGRTELLRVLDAVKGGQLTFETQYFSW